MQGDVDNIDPPWLSKKHFIVHATSWATVSPLLAAIVAPLSVLLDIPALAETWYTLNGNPLPDPTASLVLSGISLAFSIIADALLLVRFSVYDQYWRLATHVSVVCWLAKCAVGLSNLVVFGILSRNEPIFAYDEGFWCAVMSFLTSCIVFLLLVFHWLVNFVPVGNANSLRVRRHGRHFMMHNLYFMLVIAVTAAIMLKIEGWSYLQGIYFSIVTFTTIGFGDFYPTQTASKIVMFPLALLGIAELTALVTLLVGFFSNVSKERAARSRLKFERQRRKAQDTLKDPRTLEGEIEFLEKLHRNRDWRDHAVEAGWSVGSFVCFWVIGAEIFSRIEGWDYGTGLYFNWVFFFVIGYGDLYVVTPAGRVVFVVYAILAVPVMTSFAVQTLASIFSRISENRLNQNKRKSLSSWHKGKAPDEETVEPDESDLVSHAEYVTRERQRLQKARPKDIDAMADKHKEPQGENRHMEQGAKRASSAEYGSKTVQGEVEKHEEEGAERLSTEDELPQSNGDVPSTVGESAEKNAPTDTAVDDDDVGSVDTEEEARDEDSELTSLVLDKAAELERIARRLLINNLPSGSPGQILLKADWHVQLEEMRAVLYEEAEDAVERKAKADGEGTEGRESKDSEDARMRKRVDEEAELVLQPLTDKETMDVIRKYRQCFASMLVLGSRLRKLKGQEQYLFERRRAVEDD